MAKKYDVVLSFAGEDRTMVEMVAEQLKARGVSYFYDKDEESDLLGKNLVEHLTQIYQHEAKYMLMFVSQHYAKKNWTRIERRAAQAEAFSRVDEYIIPLPMDDTELPGMLKTVGHMDLRKRAPVDVAIAVAAKLGKNPFETMASDVPSPRSPLVSDQKCFNYRSHNGRYRIGAGSWEFESRWQTCGSKSVYCLVNSKSVRGIALVPATNESEALRDVSLLDNTNNSEVVDAGRMIVLQNKNGIYALVEVLDVKNKKDGTDVYELCIRWWIQRDGSKDLTSAISPAA